MARTKTIVNAVVAAKSRPARKAVAKVVGKKIDKLQAKVEELKSLVDMLLKLSTPAIDLHYKTAKQVHAIMTHPDYESQGPQFPRELDEILMRVLPGMGKLTLKNMFHHFPDKQSWVDMNLREIYNATIEKMQEEKPKPPRTPKPAVENATKENLGGGWGQFSKEKVQELVAERDALRQRVADLEAKLNDMNATLVEVMLERDQLRAALAKKK